MILWPINDQSPLIHSIRVNGTNFSFKSFSLFLFLTFFLFTPYLPIESLPVHHKKSHLLSLFGFTLHFTLHGIHFLSFSLLLPPCSPPSFSLLFSDTFQSLYHKKERRIESSRNSCHGNKWSVNGMVFWYVNSIPYGDVMLLERKIQRMMKEKHEIEGNNGERERDKERKEEETTCPWNDSSLHNRLTLV